ncbi:MAG: peroxiredoxin-like family protein [Cyanobacteria bacterium P01_H01_bin.58]
MNLTQALADFRDQFRANRPQEVLTVMQQATEDLEQSPIVNQALTVGDQIPVVELPNAVGDRVSIQNLLAQGPVVISFYRGGWCPYCNLELRALQSVLPELTALGVNLVTISPETPDNSLSTQEKNELSFQVLSDVGNQVARSFGLVFTLSETLRPLYNNFGIDIPAHNGDETFELPIPATYIVRPDGTIAHAFINADYTQRMDPQEILAALKML